MLTPAESIAAYIRAKDGNRPHLLDASFAADATLTMLVRTDAISFPPVSEGRDAIAEILVRRFNQIYENVYTLCLSTPPEPDARSFSCNWLVAMSEKLGGAVRVGCGRYDWLFEGAEHRVRSLTIIIETMAVLPPEALEPVMNWMAGLPSPWCSPRMAGDAAPSIPEVHHALQVLARA